MVVLPLALTSGIFLAEAGWLEGALVGAAAGLVWSLWRSRQQSNAALAEHARQLAEQREKNAEIEREKATLSQENKAKSEMLATLSRDIRGHLNGIMGAADLLVDPTLKPRQRDHLTTLRASAESLHQSLNDIIDYSGIETGQIKIAQAPFELRQPLTDVVETVSPLALTKGLELILIVAPDVPSNVTGDIARLRQILLNLTSNAVKFTHQGRVVLRLALASGESAPPPKPGVMWLHFSVSDTGPAIPADMLATLFDRPSPSAATSPRNFGSAGLELAIVKRLVELMGGKIGVRALPEGGSEFWVTLALTAEKEAPVPLARNTTLHVVALDGLAAARIAVSEMLTRLGIDYTTTDAVPQALEMLRDALEAEATELVLLVDEVMAKKHSAAITRALASDPALSITRVVLMSPDPEGVVPESYDFPIATVLRKPLLRPESLLDAVSATPTAAAARPSGSRAPFVPAGPAVERPRTRVLVVDDDSISRSVSSQLLAILHCEVDLAVSGPAAIERAAQTKYDIIFMDCQMPEMDGYEATRRIVAASNGKGAPIVALTANTSPADREKCFAAGMNDFIAKPVHKADLARILKRWTRREPARAK